MSEEMYKSMFQDAIRALAAIDTALGMPDDGCNSTERTITAIKLLHAVREDDEAEIGRLRGLLREAGWLVRQIGMELDAGPGLKDETWGRIGMLMQATPPLGQDWDSAADQPAAVRVVFTMRECTACGAQWDYDRADCPRCARAADKPGEVLP